MIKGLDDTEAPMIESLVPLCFLFSCLWKCICSVQLRCLWLFECILIKSGFVVLGDNSEFGMETNLDQVWTLILLVFLTLCKLADLVQPSVTSVQ